MDQTLKTRAITAVFFTIAVLALLFINSFTQVALFWIIGLGSTFELLTMSKTDNTKKFFILTAVGLMYFLAFAFPIANKALIFFNIIVCLFYIFTTITLFSNNPKPLKLLPYSTFIYPAAMSFIVISGLSADTSFSYVLIFGTIVLIWLSDSFAYLVGRKLGKRKLFERVSPKKTWEGFWGGGLAAIIGSIILTYIYTNYSLRQWLSIAILAWIIGTIGDLTQSSIKRAFHVKDSGTILPGHGGFFDRFDSLIYVLPFVYLILNYS